MLTLGGHGNNSKDFIPLWSHNVWDQQPLGLSCPCRSQVGEMERMLKETVSSGGEVTLQTPAVPYTVVSSIFWCLFIGVDLDTVSPRGGGVQISIQQSKSAHSPSCHPVACTCTMCSCTPLPPLSNQALTQVLLPPCPCLASSSLFAHVAVCVPSVQLWRF